MSQKVSDRERFFSVKCRTHTRFGINSQLKLSFITLDSYWLYKTVCNVHRFKVSQIDKYIRSEVGIPGGDARATTRKVLTENAVVVLEAIESAVGGAG